jgi:membrane carboxypeptidase/penicillin-binding protein
VDAGELRASTTARSRSAARSRTRATSATIHVAQAAGYDHVAAFWKKLGVGDRPKPIPSIALGVFEATPYEIATAYTLFPNGGAIRRFARSAITRGGKDVTKKSDTRPRRCASRRRRSSSPT